jgi:hypothetical protein
MCSEKINNSRSLAEYYQEYYGEEFRDLTFEMSLEDSSIVSIPSHKIEQKLCYNSQPLPTDLFCDSNDISKKSAKLIVQNLKQIANSKGCSEILLSDKLYEGNLSTMSAELFNQEATYELLFNLHIDFQDFTEANFFKGLRKSYKSLVNWGRKNLVVDVVNAQNYSYDKFMKFKEFHALISGRQTRSDESWDIQAGLSQNGGGELILAYLNDELVAGSFFLDEFKRSRYFNGVYQRDLFHLGIAHYPVYMGIVRSQMRNPHGYCHLGSIMSDNDDNKLKNIEFFKKGFCPRLTPSIVWRLSCQS